MSFVPRIGRTGNGVPFRGPRALGRGSSRSSGPIINLPNRISSASGRLEKVGTRLPPASSRHSFSGLFSFSLFGFFDVDGSYNPRDRVSRVARRRVDGSSRSKSRPENETRERDEGLEGGRGSEGKGSVGRSDGRRFHFVSLPACGGAIAAALCQSVTLSRHPFYYLAGGCPAHSTSCQPETPFPTYLPTGHGYNVDQARGCLTSCRVFSPLSFSVHSPISFPLAQALDLHPQREKTREAGGNAASDKIV